jgi:hypothetical protein
MDRGKARKAVRAGALCRLTPIPMESAAFFLGQSALTGRTPARASTLQPPRAALPWVQVLVRFQVRLYVDRKTGYPCVTAAIET